MAANKFIVSILEDGKISVKSVGGFDKTTHESADDFLAMMQELAGGPFSVRKNIAKPNERKTEQHHTQ